jgi:hypothetical protein
MVVGREYGYLVSLNKLPGLKIGYRHSHTQSPGLVTAGDDTAVVITQHHNGLVVKIRPEQPFTGAIETVAVDDSCHKEWIT